MLLGKLYPLFKFLSRISINAFFCLGVLLSQYIVGPVSEHTMFTALLLVESATAFVVQFVGIGSAVAFFVAGLPLFVSLVLNPLFSSGKGDISLVTYAIGHVFSILTGTMMILPVLEFFVPLVRVLLSSVTVLPSAK
jgi:hypothetical protein